MLLRKRRIRELPLAMRKTVCQCVECSKVYGNGILNDGINEPIVGDCEGFCKGWKIIITEK